MDGEEGGGGDVNAASSTVKRVGALLSVVVLNFSRIVCPMNSDTLYFSLILQPSLALRLLRVTSDLNKVLSPGLLISTFILS